MWIFLNDAFISVVNGDEGNLVVRSRGEHDLKKVFGKDTVVVVEEDRDYRFRTFVSKEQFSKVMSDRIMNIDYDNFKNSVKDKERSKVYLDVWVTMNEWQEKLYGGMGRLWKSYFKDRYGDVVMGSGTMIWDNTDQDYLRTYTREGYTINEIYDIFQGDYSKERIIEKQKELQLV